jgi:hypothetical protein
MPTSANKDIVDSKYSKYGENNMIIEGFASGHEHSTDETDATTQGVHKHTIPATGVDHAQEMDCYEVENEQNEYIELIPKPIPSLFNKDDTAGQLIMGFFIAFMIILFMYVIVSVIWNKLPSVGMLRKTNT